MKKIKSLFLGEQGDLIRAPAYPVAGYKLLAELREAHRAGGRLPPLQHLAAWLGIGVSTGHNWLCVGSLSQLQALLCLLERTPEAKWLPLLRGFLRDWPSLEHRRLNHDPVRVKQLAQLLAKPTGLTLIRGGSEEQRTFLLTALGHSVASPDSSRQVVGLDRHEPRSFVPLTKVLYFRSTTPRSRQRSLILKHWSAIHAAHHDVIVLNGVLSAVPELKAELQEVSAKCHVLVADDSSGLSGLEQLSGARLIQIAAATGAGTRIVWQIRA